MRMVLIPLVCMCLWSAVFASKATPQAKEIPSLDDDLKKLEGGWVLSRTEPDGKKVDLFLAIKATKEGGNIGVGVVVNDTGASGSITSFKLEEKDKKRFMLLGDNRVEYQFLEGDKLRLKSEKQIKLTGIKEALDFTGEWKRKKDK